MIRRIEDILRAAVVLFELDNRRIGKVALEVQDNLDIRASEGIDGVMDDNAPRNIIAEVGDG